MTEFCHSIIHVSVHISDEFRLTDYSTQYLEVGT